MTVEQVDIYFENRTKEFKRNLFYPILVTVIGGVILFIAIALFTYFGKIRKNENNISDLKVLKLETKTFNDYLNTQNKINALSEERLKILTGRIEDLETKSNRLNQIDVEIARLQEKINRLLDSYGMKTRGGEEVQLSLECFLQETET